MTVCSGRHEVPIVGSAAGPAARIVRSPWNVPTVTYSNKVFFLCFIHPFFYFFAAS